MSNLPSSFSLFSTFTNSRLMQNHQQMLLAVSILLIVTIPEVFADTYNCPNGCSVVIQQNAQPTITTQTTPATITQSGPTINGINLKSGTDWLINQIETFFHNIEGTAIPNNPYVNPTGIQNATTSGFKIVNDLSNAGYDTSQFVTDLINSFKPFHISFWIVLLISTAITIVIILKAGEGILRRMAYLGAAVGAILLIFLFLHIYTNI